MEEELSVFGKILDLNEFNVVNVEENEDDVIFTIKPKRDILPCPKCGYPVTRKNGPYRRTVQDLSLLKGKRTILHIIAHQYECLNPEKETSHRIFVPVYDAFDSYHQMTRRLKEAIAQDSLKKSTFASVADKYEVDAGTIRSIFLEKVRELDEQYKLEAPEHIGLDEAHLHNDMRLIVVDTSVRNDTRLIDIVKSRKIDFVEATLNRFDNPDNIKTVTIDMWSGYRTAVQTCLPHARIIVDRFHVMVHLIDAMEETRKLLCARIVREAEADPEKQALMKRVGFNKINHYWFKTDFEALKARPESFRKFAAIINAFPELGVVYKLKKEFHDLYENCETRKEAEARYATWVDSIPKAGCKKVPTTDAEIRLVKVAEDFQPYLSFCKTVKNWRTEIFNYFDDPVGRRFSNGPVEAIVGSIKNISRAGYGYSFEALRGKVIFGESRFVVKMGRKKPRPASGKRSYKDSCLAFMAGHLSEEICMDVEALFSTDIPSLAEIRKVYVKHTAAEFVEQLNSNNNISIPFLISAKILDTMVFEYQDEILRQGIPVKTLKEVEPIYGALFALDSIMGTAP